MYTERRKAERYSSAPTRESSKGGGGREGERKREIEIEQARSKHVPRGGALP